MFKYIYDNFKHFYHGGNIYFYSDPHFADPEMKYLRHDYIGDNEQIKSINSKIGKNDTIIILGDIGDKEMLKKIRGYKVLLLGNHDSGATTYYGYVDEVYEGPLFLSEKILLSHEPIDFPYALNIHGHDHSGWTKNSNHINVCAEHINYTPVALSDIVKSGALKSIESIHRFTINEATRKKHKN